MLADGMETYRVRCPYCGESVEVLLESDVRGEMVQDCEVCCHPWRLRIAREPDGARVEVSALDD